MNWTDEQFAAIAAAKEGRDVFCRALAGTGKTTVLKAMLLAAPGSPFAVAFNKAIAEELTLAGIPCKTFNSLGAQVWDAATGRRHNPDKAKLRNLLHAILAAANLTLSRKETAEVLHAVSSAKHAGYVPPLTKRPGRSLGPRPESWPEDPDLEKLAQALLLLSIEQAYKGSIDFDDQVYMPTCFACAWPKPPLLGCDEIQDLNALNVQMIKKLSPRQFIGVGDEKQAIYAFRGAMHDAWDKVRESRGERNRPVTLQLTVTWRCSLAVVAEARSHAPLQARPNAPQGSVSTHPDPFLPAQAEAGSAIICRNNAPLASVALALLRLRRPICYLASDSLGSVLKDVRIIGLKSGNLRQAITQYYSGRIGRSEDKAELSRLEDRRDMLLALADGSAVQLEQTIRSLLNPSSDPSAVTLTTIHRAKGLEWDTVYFLDPDLIPAPWAEGAELAQELNLRYVAQTRAKLALHYVYSKGAKQ